MAHARQHFQPGAGNAGHQRVGLIARGHAVFAADHHQGGLAQLVQPGAGVVRQHAIAQPAHRLPRRLRGQRAHGLQHGLLAGQKLAAKHPGQHVGEQLVAAASALGGFPAGGNGGIGGVGIRQRAGQHQPRHLGRMLARQVLRHHAAIRQPQHMGAGNAQRIQQAGHIVGLLGQRVGVRLGLAALPLAAQIQRQHLKLAGVQRRVPAPGGGVHGQAVEQDQGVSVSGAAEFVIQRMAIGQGVHGHVGKSCGVSEPGGRKGRWLGWPSVTASAGHVSAMACPRPVSAGGITDFMHSAKNRSPHSAHQRMTADRQGRATTPGH